MYKNEGKALYFDSNLKKVEAGSPYIAHVVAEGASLKNEEALKFGLIKAEPVAAEAKAEAKK